MAPRSPALAPRPSAAPNLPGGTPHGYAAWLLGAARRVHGHHTERQVPPAYRRPSRRTHAPGQFRLTGPVLDRLGEVLVSVARGRQPPGHGGQCGTQVAPV